MRERQTQRRRSWILAILAMLLATAVAVAGTTGNLTGIVTGPNGSPVAGVKVTVTGPNLQGARTATTDSQGFFRLTQLPSGDAYKARFEGSGFQTTERAPIVINVDSTIRIPTVKLKEAKAAEAIEIVETAPMVSSGNTTIGRTMSNDFLSAVPTGRNTTSVLTLAPGAATDSYGVSFRGATSPENSYIIDGLNTTGVIYGLDSSSLPIEFIQEVQVKTGGYEPEYGRATGGQSIVITKSGGNEFHGNVFAYITPFEGPRSSTVSGQDRTETPTYEEAVMVRRDHIALTGQLGFDIGGYIIKDRLWFFAGFAPSYTKRVIRHEFRTLSDITAEQADVAEAIASNAYVNPSLSDKAFENDRVTMSNYYLANITYNLSPEHSVRLSASGNPGSVKGMLGSPLGDPSTYRGQNNFGAMDFVLQYNGKFAEGLANLDTIVGLHTEQDKDSPLDGEDAAYYNNYISHVNRTSTFLLTSEQAGQPCKSNGAEVDCHVYGYGTGGYGAFGRTAAQRLTIKPILSLFLNNMVGNHVIKIGGDMERNTASDGRGYTGDSILTESTTFWRERYYIANADPVELVGVGSDDPAASLFVSDTVTTNVSAFAQDSWSVLPNLTLNLGVRWERQALADVNGQVRLAINDNIAPRVGVTFDFTNEGKSKIFANYGRYYESIPQDMNSRAMAPEGFAFFRFDKSRFPDYDGSELLGTDPAYQNPYYASSDPRYTGSGIQFLLGGEQAYIQKGLKGMYNDQALLGFEYEVAKDLSAGLTLVWNRLGNVIEDISPDNGATYVIANPGEESFTYSYVEDGVIKDGETEFARCFSGIDILSGAPTTYCFPKPTRTYRGVELTAQKRFGDGWTAQGSYTWSQTYGNYPGLFTQSNLQLDPNITSQYDLAGVLVNRQGILEQDRTHQLKVAGAYQFKFGTSLGLTANIQSGTPITYLGSDYFYGASEAFALPRGTVLSQEEQVAVGIPEKDLIPERTPWAIFLDANARHELRFANKKTLALGVQLNNFVNRQTPLRVDNNYTLSYTSPAAGGTSLSQVQCYDFNAVGYLVGREKCALNVNFGNAVEYQAPLNVRLEAKFSF